MLTDLETIAHVLICRTDNIGDVVLTLPLAGFLKTRFPGIKVDFLVRTYAAPVVQLCQFVDHVYNLEAICDARQFFSSGNWDAVIFAWPESHLTKAARQAGIRYRVGHSQRLHHWILCNKLAHFSRSKPPLHEAQINFAFLRPLGISMTPSLAQIIPWYGLHAKPDAKLCVCTRPDAFQLILHTKSGGHGREWPLQHYLELAQSLMPQQDVVLCLTGSEKEGEYLHQHIPALLEQKNVVNLCGKLGLSELASLIACADGLIASGTGPLHIAAALGRPALGLFPSLKHMGIVRWGALGAHAQNLSTSTPCEMCTGVETCQCMQQIRPQQVERIVAIWISAWRSAKMLTATS